MSSAISFNLDQSKILSSGNELNTDIYHGMEMTLIDLVVI